MPKLSFEEFVRRCNLKHKNKYEYVDTELKNLKSNIRISCPDHGLFTQRADKHMSGSRCQKCYFDSLRNNYSFKEFLERANSIHENTYSYNKDLFKVKEDSVVITCSTHGDFKQLKHNHLDGKGCLNCSNEAQIKYNTFEKFLEAAKIIHKEKYTYLKNSYVNRDSLVTIICSTHGEFFVLAKKHIYGQGCETCSRSKYSSQDYSKMLKEKFDNKISLKTSSWVNISSPATLFCRKHDEFVVDNPRRFLLTKGCYVCYKRKAFSRLELDVLEYIKTISKTSVIHSDRTVIKPYEIDIFLPELKIGFEVNGDYWHSDEVILRGRNMTAKEWHSFKKNKALENGVTLYFIWESDWNSINNKIKENILKSFKPGVNIDSIELLVKLEII